MFYWIQKQTIGMFVFITEKKEFCVLIKHFLNRKTITVTEEKFKNYVDTAPSHGKVHKLFMEFCCPYEHNRCRVF